MASTTQKDLRSDARNFCESLGNVFMMKRRDPQTQHLLEKSKTLIESLLQESRTKTERPVVPPKPSRSGSSGMGQLWVKLDEMKRENDILRKKVVAKTAEEKSVSSKSQGPGEVIIAELHKCKLDNEMMTKQLEKYLTSIKELEKVNFTLQDECKRTKISHGITQESLEKIRHKQRTLESSLGTVQTENDHLKTRLKTSVKPMKRPDASLVENINEKCRPSTVAMEYNRLESEQWVDAKEALEDAGCHDEVSATTILADIIMTCYSASMDLLSEVESIIAGFINNPCNMLQKSFQSDDKERTHLPNDILTGVKDCLRHNTLHVDLKPLVNKCKERMISGRTDCSRFEEHINHTPIHNYVEHCVRITWKMVTQNSPMWLNIDDTCLDEEIHRLWWSCDKCEARTIKYFIWPALYDCKDGNLLVKGCVFTSSKKALLDMETSHNGTEY